MTTASDEISSTPAPVKATAGPWELEHNEDLGEFALLMGTAIKNRSRYQAVHRIELYDDFWPEEAGWNEALANAHLIAAAPDLRDALERCLAELKQHAAGVSATEIAIAECVLAKANGGRDG